MDRLAGLQILRAVAAIMVLAGHVLAEAEHYFRINLPGDAIPWTRGVDIFFVISGFIITVSARRFVGQPGAFLWRRALRVAPLYYLFTTLMVVTLVVLPGAAKETTLDPGQIISSYLFLPFEREDGRLAPVLSPGWTLNYEMFFYAITAVCLLFPRPVPAIISIIGAIAVIGFAPVQSTYFTFWTNPIMIEFLFGIGLAQVFLRGLRLPSAIVAGVTFCGGVLLLVALDSLHLPRFVAAGLPALIIVASGTVFCPPARPGQRIPGQILGDASYALYLSHRFALRALTLLALPLLPTGAVGAWIYCALACSVALGAGVLVFLWIERPMLRALSPRPVFRKATA